MFAGFSAEKMKNTMIGITLAILTVVVIIQLLANLIPTVLMAFGNLSVVSGLSFASFYGSSGVVNIIFGVTVLILVIVLIFNLLGTKSSK